MCIVYRKYVYTCAYIDKIYIYDTHTHSHLLTCLPQANRLCMGEGDLCVENISGTLGTDFEKKYWFDAGTNQN